MNKRKKGLKDSPGGCSCYFLVVCGTHAVQPGRHNTTNCQASSKLLVMMMNQREKIRELVGPFSKSDSSSKIALSDWLGSEGECSRGCKMSILHTSIEFSKVVRSLKLQREVVAYVEYYMKHDLGEVGCRSRARWQRSDTRVIPSLQRKIKALKFLLVWNR